MSIFVFEIFLVAKKINMKAKILLVQSNSLRFEHNDAMFRSTFVRLLICPQLEKLKYENAS